ncbi:uncharacterized protein DEA37_0000544 [Paragonimus westermani]|uniref:Uncharacterized protein n=1 Tax=Paragonimus westermani TaxID=34504 RepID=A0A5J4ND88_9TREM|nr:uncharacterized protein DEA37_0000544 [Paragonimus westermani]
MKSERSLPNSHAQEVIGLPDERREGTLYCPTESQSSSPESMLALHVPSKRSNSLDLTKNVPWTMKQCPSKGDCAPISAEKNSRSTNSSKQNSFDCANTKLTDRKWDASKFDSINDCPNKEPTAVVKKLRPKLQLMEPLCCIPRPNPFTMGQRSSSESTLMAQAELSTDLKHIHSFANEVVKHTDGIWKLSVSRLCKNTLAAYYGRIHNGHLNKCRKSTKDKCRPFGDTYDFPLPPEFRTN